MNMKVLSAVLLGIQLVSGVANANGYGAIACDRAGSGNCSAVSDYAHQADAYTAAINLCQRGGYSCYIYSWEYLSCTYGPNGSYACN